MKSIAVVGAGIAGLSCATRLRELDFLVHVFEKSSNAGGRMSTRRGEDWQCDHGAQYFTAHDSAFRAEVTRWCVAGAAAPWHPVVRVRSSDGWAAPKSTVARFVGTPAMTAPARLLAGALPATYGATVVKLNHAPNDHGSWQVLTADGESWVEPFSAVVLALPAPQAVALLDGRTPQWEERILAVRPRACWALMLQFAEPVPLAFDAAFINEGALGWIARDNNKPLRDAGESWLLHATPAWSDLHLDHDTDWVGEALIAEFIALGGVRPQQWQAHRWRYARCDHASTVGALWDDSLRVGLCGDWLNSEKVEGAWLSGRKLAEQISLAWR